MTTSASAISISQSHRSAPSVSAKFALLICVKYGSDKETERYLNSIRTLEGQQKLRVLVVDNTVESNWVRTSSQPDYHAIQAPSNLGYFGGARHALSLYLAEKPLPDWVIISNVDLFIDDPHFLRRLEELGSIPDLGAVAPSIQSSLTGKDQNPYMRRRPSTARMQLYKWMFQSWIVLNLYEGVTALFHTIRTTIGKLRPNSSRASSRESIYAPHGSFLILSRSYFERGGDLQFPEFLFGEEVYLAESMRRVGLNVLYEPSLRVIHQEHNSTRLFKSRKIAAYVASSAAYCADEFFALNHHQ